MDHLIRAGVFACVGVAFEVAFTAAAAWRRNGDLRLLGKSYVWMFPIYALAYPALALLHPVLGGRSLAVRGSCYVLLLYTVEFLSGWLLRRLTGRCPWDYGSAPWAVRGLIRLDFAPAWLLVTLTFERLYIFLV